MADKKNEFLYNTAKLSVIFGIASVILFLVVLCVIVDDYSREWKKYQRSFNKMQVEQTKGELEELTKKTRQKKMARIEKKLKEEEESLKEQKTVLKEKEKQLKQLDKEILLLDTDLKSQQAELEAIKYQFEEQRAHSDEHLVQVEVSQESKLALLKEELNRWKILVGENKSIKGELIFQRTTLENEINSILENKSELVESLALMRSEEKRVKDKIKNLKPSLFNAFRNSPMFDFIAPTLRIRQLVMEDLYDDLSFVQVPKIDRCTTCHLGIDLKGFEDAPQPFTTHPNLDLYVSSSSPHAMETFGCTSCHSGNGQAIDFYHAGHAANSNEQAHEWEEKYDWHPLKHWAEPMLPLKYVESSCLQCHDQQLVIPEAVELNEGRQLFEEMGCVGCHEVKGLPEEEIRKAGPSLKRIRGKVDPGWTAKWLKDPKSFRPDTKMPSFFGLSNAASEEVEDTQVHAIVTYLFDQSEEFVPEEITGEGDAEQGQKLVKEIGCLGCHSVGEDKVSDFAPNLSQIGSKVNVPWLVDWLKNPKHYNPETSMPSLRLTDQEALDVAAFLVTLKNEPFEELAEPELNQDALEEMVREDLREGLTDKQVNEKLASMSQDEKVVYLGEKLTNFYGCYACHDISGFEDATRIGVELTHESSKPMEQFDFGFVDVPHTHQSFYQTKIKQPRIFDQGKEKTRKEKLRMPQFNLTEDQRNSLVTYLSGLKVNHVPMNRLKLLDEQERLVEDGKRLIRDMNCAGCHEVDTGVGGDIGKYVDDSVMAPPSIVGQGARVQGDWFHEFLKAPSEIRPWLKTRMPTFGFTDEEIDVIIKHFRAEDGVEETFSETKAQPTEESLAAGALLFDQLRCIQCHAVTEGMVGSSGEVSASELAPNLLLSRDRLRHEWIVDWLKNPDALMPGTGMPGYFPDLQSPLPDILEGDAMKQIIALRDYVVQLPEENDKKKKK